MLEDFFSFLGMERREGGSYNSFMFEGVFVSCSSFKIRSSLNSLDSEKL
jgi:hypothetical protein